MIIFKACPKCQGELYVTEDHFGKYRTCLQCGFLQDLEMLAHQAGPNGEAAEPIGMEKQYSLAA
jgi:DNA-directed RNA polymerase subunit M/transcription elongation factor TFIIS